MLDVAAISIEYRHGGAVPAKPVSGAPPVAQAFVLPGDVVRSMGGGSREAGLAAADEMFGHHRAYGRGVVHPDVVRHIGDGNITKGRRVLQKFVALTRKQAANKSRHQI
jgi:hypothetical protein